MNAIRLRPVIAQWQCQRDGSCCEQPGEVVMTHAERAAIEGSGYPSSPATLSWLPHADSRFVRLSAGPCPLFARDAQGKGVCAVYDVRPFNCRRFGCFRPSPEREAFEPEANVIGCANLRERLEQSGQVRREFQKLADKAREWALSHGWGEGQ